MDAATAEKVRLADEKFRQQEAEYERKVVTPEGETVAELRAAFELVANKEYWKLPWVAWVPVALAGRVQRAVEFFHADLARAGEENGKGEILMVGRGYQAW